jgi:hypothetical protein
MKTIAESEIVLTESEKEKEKELSSMSEALCLSTVAENEELNENETD